MIEIVDDYKSYKIDLSTFKIKTKDILSEISAVDENVIYIKWFMKTTICDKKK